jgi:hypothetical protein
MITMIKPPVIWYQYKGDEICWDGTMYHSIMVGSFKTLEEMDKFWDAFSKAYQKTEVTP